MTHGSPWWNRVHYGCLVRNFAEPTAQQINYQIEPLFEDLHSGNAKISWNSCRDLAYSYAFPFTRESLDKILFMLTSHKPLEFLDRNLGNSLIKMAKKLINCKTRKTLFIIILLLYAKSFFEVLVIGQYIVLKQWRGSLIHTLIIPQMKSVFVCSHSILLAFDLKLWQDRTCYAKILPRFIPKISGVSRISALDKEKSGFA